MDKFFFLIFTLVSVYSVYGQSSKDSVRVPLEVYKTYDDFFSGNNKTRIADCITCKNNYKFKCHDGVKIDLVDSAFAGYTWGNTEGWDKNKKTIRDDKTGGYNDYLGGCKKLLLIAPGITGTAYGRFREDGNFLEGTLSDDGPPEFIKDLDFKKKRFRKLEDAIEDNPEVLNQMLAEKKATKGVIWAQNRLYYYLKYIDLYCGK
jgi:hypothetical protein